MNKDNYYFVERATEKDLIGFKSYVNSLKIAISSGAKFIGVISDFGTGKSSLIKILENEVKKDCKFVTINLWNCENAEKKGLNIHQIFLYQLIEQLEIRPKDYYKNKINKYYRKFDVNFENLNKFIIIILLSIYLLILFDKLGIITLFVCYVHKLMIFILLSFSTILCLIAYKPLISFTKNETLQEIDENDTKNLYVDILEKYFKNKKSKKLIISMEDIDRYDSYEDVIIYLKEFYKFYKLAKYDVTFITSIKPASKLLGKNKDSNEINKIKSIYEKVFDYILNLNRFNIQDYEEIICKIFNEETLTKPEKIEFPVANNVNKWKYIYQGSQITIRDIKHRYNFALSLYESVKESKIKDADFYKCLFISYLEDDFNELYEFLIDNPKVFNDMLIYYASNKNLDKYKGEKVNEHNFTEEEINILIDAFSQKLISVDYVYYFYKYPNNKKSYNPDELVLYNAVLFDEDSENLQTSINKIDESQMKEIIDKRKNISLYPNVIFVYSDLLRVAYEHSPKTLYNTLNTSYDLISDFNKFEDVVDKIYNLKKEYYLEIFEIYFQTKKEKLLQLNIDEKNNIRLNLVNIFKEDAVLFNYLFQNDNDLITAEEMRSLNNLKLILKLTNYYKINEEFITNIIKYVNNSYKTIVNELLYNISSLNIITDEMYQKVFNSIDFNKYNFIDNELKKIYKFSYNKLGLSEKANLILFIRKIKKYNTFLDNKLLELLDCDLKEDIKEYIEICGKYNFDSENGIDFISKNVECFELPINLLNVMYKIGNYHYYVKSKIISDKKFYIETDKFEILKKIYIQVFVEKNDWKSIDIDKAMNKYLFDNVNFGELSTSQLRVFNNEIQSIDIINAVLNSNDKNFIETYLKNIKNINKEQETEIFKLFVNYYNKNGLDYKVKKNLKNLTNSKKLINLLDGRKNKIKIKV